MKKLHRAFVALTLAVAAIPASAQFNKSGINAGFFDSSEQSQLNFTDFHLPPLAVLYENAKSNPNILILAKQQQIAKAEVEKQKEYYTRLTTTLREYIEQRFGFRAMEMTSGEIIEDNTENK